MDTSSRGSSRADTITLAIGFGFVIVLTIGLLVGPFVAAVLWRDFGPMPTPPASQQRTASRH